MEGGPGVDILNLVVKLAHVTSAVAGLGGFLFVWLVAGPLARANEDLYRPLFRGFGILFGVCLLLLLGTGIYNIAYIAPRMGTTYNMVFGAKFTLSLIFFALALGIHHPARMFEGLRSKRASWMLALAVIGVVILALSVQMNSMRVWNLPQKPLL